MRKLILAFALLASALYGQDRKRVAVMNFEYGTVQSSVASIFGRTWMSAKASRTCWSTGW